MDKDFLCISEQSEQRLLELIKRGVYMKNQITANQKSMDILKGKTVVTLFYENSTRTRCSFELAAKYLGANVISVGVSQSSVQKGENLIDTAVTLDKMQADVVVIRHSVSGAPQIIANNIKASVINAGDGLHAHPTQALLDFFTMQEHFGKIKGLEVSIIGDIKHSRVARSNIVGLNKLGAKVRVYAPNTMMPQGLEEMGVTVCKNIEHAFDKVDVVMGLRIQLERQGKGAFPSLGEYNKFYGINSQRMQLTNKNSIVLHPGPVNRGVELSYDVLDKDYCLKDEQVLNGVCVRMALLESLCLKH